MTAALLSHGDVAKLLGISKPSLYEIRKKDPAFPKPLDLPGLSRPKWTVPMITMWMERKAREAWDATRQETTA